MHGAAIVSVPGQSVEIPLEQTRERITVPTPQVTEQGVVVHDSHDGQAWLLHSTILSS